MRLQETADRADVLAERGPLDFAAYLMALEELGRSSGTLIPRATAIAADSLATVDLVVLVPLDERHRIQVPDDEDPALRSAMDHALLELADELEADGAARFLTVGGDRRARLESMLAAVDG